MADEQVDQNGLLPAAVAGGPVVGGGMAPPVAPDDDDDRVTFEDSEMFEEDILSASDTESVNQNWRGWHDNVQPEPDHVIAPQESTSIGISALPLKSLAAKVAASSMSFEQLEAQNHGTPIPTDLFCYIIKFVFPQNSEDIRMYSFLTNGSQNEYDNGHALYKAEAVKDALQIGYRLTASVEIPPRHQHASGKGSYFVDIGIDRCRVTSCRCTCSSKSSWCQHVVAVCLYRIHHADSVKYRGINWLTINSMPHKNVVKLFQNFINTLPAQYLPVAQNIMDQLADPNSDISQSDGAPDPTDGEHQEIPIWSLDHQVIKENIHKVLTKICVPGPTVHCDVNCLSSNLSPTLTEWVAIFRSMKSKDPEGLWNLLTIASDMLKRSDPNSITLLHICTEALMANEHVLYWWYITKLSQSGFWMFTSTSKAHIQSVNGNTSQFNCSSLCDEIVNMWRLAAMNPKWTYVERENLFSELKQYHRTAVTTIQQLLRRMSQNGDAQSSFMFTVMDQQGCRLSPENARFNMHYFPGFFDALSACMIEWDLTNIKEYIAGEALEFEGNFKALGNVPIAFSAQEFASEISSQYDMELPSVDDGQSKCIRRGIKKTRRVINTRSIQARHMLQMDQASTSRRPSRHGNNQPRSPDEPTSSKNLEDARERREQMLNDDFEQIAEQLNLEISDLEARYSCCEALMAHGYSQQARNLAISVSEEMNSEAIDLLAQMEIENGGKRTSPTRIRRKKPTKAQLTLNSKHIKFLIPENHVIELSKQAAHLFARTIFLANLLSSDEKSRKVVFSLALAVLSAPRLPAATRHLEVKLYYYESTLVSLLRNFPIGDDELQLIRSVALELFENSQKGKLVRVTALPLTLIQYLLETLSESRKSSVVGSSGKSLSDKDLGFYVALEGLGLPLFVSEAEHPMLCECVRRLRGEIAMNLFMKYKDSSEKLGLILDRLLDPTIHRMYKNQDSNAAYFLERAPSLKAFHKIGARPRNPFESFIHPDDPSTSAKSAKALHSTSSSASLSDTTTPLSSSEDRSSQVSNEHDIQDDISSVDSERGVRRSTDEGNESRDESPRFSDSSSSGQNNRPTVVPFIPIIPRRRFNLPNQIPEPLATFMAELSKKLLNEAGGNQSTAIFNAHNGGQAHAGPHRLLHISSFLIGLYALGLHNKMQLNWPTRTYSTQASWIHAQALEIGRCAIEIVRHTWDNHLTPTEVAGLADKASQCREPGLVEEAAYLALTVLPRADALTISESNRALDQCKNKGLNMLELACEAVGKAADGDGVYPEVLFNVAHYWFDLSEAERDRTHDNTRLTMNTNSPQHFYTAGFNSHRYDPTGAVQMNSNPPMPYVGPMIDVRRPPPNFVNVPPHQVPQIQHPPHHLQQQQYDSANRPLHASHSAPNLNPMHPIPPPYLGAAYVITSNHHGQTVMSSLYAQSPMAPRVTMPPPNQSYYMPNTTSPGPSNVAYNFVPGGVPVSVPVPSVAGGSSQTSGISNLSPVGKRLFQAHRIGMRALEMMAGRSDDRTYDSKRYSNPPHVDNIRWLEEKTGLLGKEDCYFSFCELAARTVTSPILLSDLVTRAVHRHPPRANNLYAMCNNVTPPPPPQPAGQAQSLRAIVNQYMDPALVSYRSEVRNFMIQYGHHPSIGELMRMTVEQFHTAGATLLSRSNLTATDVEEVCELVRSFLDIHHIIPMVGRHIFDEFIRFLKKQKSCKKEIHFKINEILNGGRQAPPNAMF